MCGRYSVGAYAEELAASLHATPTVAWSPAFNIAPTRHAPVVLACGGERELRAARWGLVPPGAASLEAAGKYATFNARAESVATRPAFATAFARHRCLVPATSWFEWRRLDGGRRWPYAIRLEHAPVMAFAGVWSRWARGATVVDSFAVITVPAAASLSVIHDRMPAILPPAAWAAWLDSSTPAPAALACLAPLDDPRVDAYPVSAEVGRSSVDGAHLVRPLT